MSRIRTNVITNRMANGAPTVSNGLVISGVTTTSSINIADSIAHTGDTNTAIKFPTNDTITFETSGNERLRIQPNGRVGIGTDNPPDCTLTVCEFNSGTEIYDNIALRLQGSSGQNVAVQFTDTTGAAAYIAVQGDALRLGTNNTERLRIDSSGRALIGSIDGATHSDSSMDDLIIGSTANGKNDGLTILSGTAQNGSIAFADSGGAYQGLVGYVHNGDYLRFNTDGSERLRINKEGHLTTPSQAIFSARGQGSWNTFNSGSGWYNLGTSSYSGSNYYINHGWTTSGGGCGVRGVTSAGNSIWDNAAARFTAPVNGFYFFEISMYIRTNGGGKTFHVQPWLDSSNLNYYTSNIGNIRNSSNSLTGNTQQYPNSVMRSIVIYMAANQIFRWAVYSEGTTHFETHFDYAHQSGYLIG